MTVHQLRTGVSVSWSPPKYTSVPVQYYVIEYKTVGQWVPLADHVDAAQTTYLWTTASRGATYHFRVSSYGRVAQSQPSPMVTLVTGG